MIHCRDWGCAYVNIFRILIPAEDSKIVVGFPYIISNCEENWFIHIINAWDDGLEFITMFKAGYPDFNICKDDCRQYIKETCFCRINSFCMAMYFTFTVMSVEWRWKYFTRTLLVVGTSPYRVFRKVMWRCHVFINVWSFCERWNKQWLLIDYICM